MALTTRIVVLVMLAAVVLPESGALGNAVRLSESAQAATNAESTEIFPSQFTLQTSAGVSGYIEAF